MASDASAPKILLLGANGQLGHELHRSLGSLGNVTTLDFPEVDFANPEPLREMLQRLNPGVIVNAAAHTAVDRAESEHNLAFAINAAAPGILAQVAEKSGALLVHYSTDYIFDGCKLTPYVETDAPNPLSVYGRSKLDGEHAVSACRKHLTFRTSWVVGAHGQNFIKSMLRLAGECEALRVVSDQHGAPTSAALLADVTAKVLEQMMEAGAEDTRWGLYHLVSAGETTWHGLARHVVARATAAGLPLKAKPEAIEPIPTTEYPTPATRPSNSRLDTSKLRSTFQVTLPDWSDGVNDVLDRIISGTPT